MASTTSSLNVLFVNNTGLPDDQVFITFQNPALGSTNFDVTYQSGGVATQVAFAASTNLMSESLSLEAIGASGLTVDNASSTVVFVSYGAALTSTTSAPSFIGSSGTDYSTQFQTFELTRTGGAGDQGNLTAINYFTAPMAIQSYNGGQSGTLLQSKSYSQSAAQIGPLLSALTDGSSLAVIKNSSGQVLRYIGPSSYNITDTNPYSSFVAYLQAVSAAGQKTKIQNSNAFNAPLPFQKGSTNYNFTLNLTAAIASDGSIQMTGSISTTLTPYGGSPSAGPVFENCSVTISTSDPTQFNNTIYGQVLSSAVTFGPGWNDLGTYMTKQGLDSQGALNITQNLAIGEITTGILCGFVNSSVVPKGQTTALKDMPSSSWWALDPTIAFAQVQPNNAYYNAYANVIYGASSNQAYSIPYSDRLGTGPLINSVQYDGTTVDTWVVTLGAPVS